jgi:hypothetical protein
VTITGPAGVCLDLVMDAELRLVRLFAIDDARLRELLIVTSVAAGQVEAENYKAARRARTEATSTAPTCAINEEGRHECCE